MGDFSNLHRSQLVRDATEKFLQQKTLHQDLYCCFGNEGFSSHQNIYNLSLKILSKRNTSFSDSRLKMCMCSRSNNGHCHLHCIPPSEWKLFGCRHWQTDTHTYNEMKIEPHFGLTPTISESIRWLWLKFCEIDHVSVVYLVDEMHSSWVAFLIFEICKIN